MKALSALWRVWLLVVQAIAVALLPAYICKRIVGQTGLPTSPPRVAATG